MTHLSIAAWADLARGLASEDEVRILEAHLGSHCADCKDIAQFLTKMTTISSRMAGRSAPDAAVRLAKAIFPTQRPKSRRIARLAAELIFDSSRAPAMAGMRSTGQVGWQCVYRAGDCILDVRIEPELYTSRAALIGQVSHHAACVDQPSDFTVRLKSGRVVVAETRSNQFGEFQFEYEQQPRMQLRILLDGGSCCIQVPLRKIALAKAASADNLHLAPLGSKKRQGAGSS